MKILFLAGIYLGGMVFSLLFCMGANSKSDGEG